MNDECFFHAHFAGIPYDEIPLKVKVRCVGGVGEGMPGKGRFEVQSRLGKASKKRRGRLSCLNV